MEEMSQADKASSQAAPKDTRPLYEIGFHVVPTLEEAQVAGVVDTIRNEVAKAGGTVGQEQVPVKMPLAYVVERATTGRREKYGEAYFGWIQFNAEDNAGIPALEEFLRNNKEILRFLLIKTTPAAAVAPRRAVFSSNRLEGETIKKPATTREEGGAVSEADLEKSIDALVSEEKEV